MSAPVAEGDEMTPWPHTPNIGQAVRFCALNWSFVPQFYDPAAAAAAGMPGTLVPGPLKLGLLYRAVEDWLGDRGYIRHVRAAHRRPDITGKPITVLGKVVRTYSEDGRDRADLELFVANEAGEPSVRGFASVEFR